MDSNPEKVHLYIRLYINVFHSKVPINSGEHGQATEYSLDVIAMRHLNQYTQYVENKIR